MVKEHCSFNTISEGANSPSFSTEFLKSVEFSGLTPFKPGLKGGSPVILIRNFDLPRLCNGTWMILGEFHENLILAEINIGAFKNGIVMIP